MVFRATVLAENHKMIQVFSDVSQPQQRTQDGGVVEVQLALDGRAGPWSGTEDQS